MHLTDVHLDVEYKVGTITECGSALCCREETGYPKPGEKGAGKWGEYKCDTPVDTLENALDYVVNELKPDIIFWTGDNNPHDVWAQTNESIANYTIKVT